MSGYQGGTRHGTGAVVRGRDMSVRDDAKRKLDDAIRRSLVYGAIIRGEGCCQINDPEWTREWWVSVLAEYEALEAVARKAGAYRMIQTGVLHAALGMSAPLPTEIDNARKALDDALREYDDLRAANSHSGSDQ